MTATGSRSRTTPTSPSTEDTTARYAAYGWHVQTVDWTRGDAHHYQENVAALAEALEVAKSVTDKPTFICLKTIIGWPAPKLQGTGKAHGAALGEEEVAATKKVLGFEQDKTFVSADEVINHTRKLIERGARGPAGMAAGLRQLGRGQSRAQGAVRAADQE